MKQKQILCISFLVSVLTMTYYLSKKLQSMDLQICELNKSHSDLIKSNTQCYEQNNKSNYRQAVNVQMPGTPLDTAFLNNVISLQTKNPIQEFNVKNPKTMKIQQEDDDEPEKKEEPKVNHKKE
jgi:hypothetical protein